MPKKTSKSGAKVKVEGITPFLWYKDDAEEAARFYVSLFQGSKVTSVSPMVVEFHLAGQAVMALNGGPHHEHTDAFSFCVSCKTQEDIDALWERLSEGGETSRCGWLKDKYGVSWQIIWSGLGKAMGGRRGQQVMEAMLKMDKFDVAELKRAAKGA